MTDPNPQVGTTKAEILRMTASALYEAGKQSGVDLCSPSSLLRHAANFISQKADELSPARVEGAPEKKRLITAAQREREDAGLCGICGSATNYIKGTPRGVRCMDHYETPDGPHMNPNCECPACVDLREVLEADREEPVSTPPAADRDGRLPSGALLICRESDGVCRQGCTPDACKLGASEPVSPTPTAPQEGLEPCPFCGSKDVHIEHDDPVMLKYIYVACHGCGGQSKHSAHEERTVRAWNRRPPVMGEGERDRPNYAEVAQRAATETLQNLRSVTRPLPASPVRHNLDGLAPLPQPESKENADG